MDFRIPVRLLKEAKQLISKPRIMMGASVLIACALFGFITSPYWIARIRHELGIQSASSVIANDSHVLPPDFLMIPSLGIEAPIQYVKTKSETVYQEALRYGIVHYPGTALPGEKGNVYFFGHSSDVPWAQGNFKTVFALLPEIESDAKIIVTNPHGDVFYYRVIDRKIVRPDDLSVLDQFGSERFLLSLQASYPIGLALQRYIVVAELEQTVK